MAGPVLRLVLGDQLTRGVAALSDLDPAADVVVMAEVWDEATYVRHHPKKIAFVFSAMRHFAEALRDEGITVDYVRLEDDGNTGSLRGEVARAVARHGAARVVATEAGEWRLAEDMAGWGEACGVPVEIRADDRFLCSHEDFRAWADGRKALRMEYFYRELRQRHGVLMDGDDPLGGQWNYDKENREPPPADPDPPDPARFEPDAITEAVLDLVERRFGGGWAAGGHFGDLRPFHFAVTAEQAERALDRFIAEALPQFGDYQDAMVAGEDTLWHSCLGVYMNAGLLDPMEAVRRAEQAYRDGAAPLNAVEGYIRQILGWREYIRGIYWREMPDYAETNFLEATRPLPEFYWSGETDMRCLAQAIDQTRRTAYAHHIQRLMVTGNFALLLGVDPKQINEWYLVVYADAYEWVELPNVQGMVMYADGGLLASKPYAASGAYIDRMSDYCADCRYSVKQKTGEDACPFNYLYWNFVMENREVLAKNRRVAPILGTLDRMKDAKKQAIRADTERFLKSIYGPRSQHAAAAE
ncbi:MAG: cryptochrome/photolyase family protein [Alphaproteobacteria bacterium]|jgi:deoxyribodipyrimidine photolyase-related protein|nr:cryptochrome/photolyase family protein [Alphaproteobacteria bacterium]